MNSIVRFFFLLQLVLGFFLMPFVSPDRFTGVCAAMLCACAILHFTKTEPSNART